MWNAWTNAKTRVLAIGMIVFAAVAFLLYQNCEGMVNGATFCVLLILFKAPI